MNTGAHGQDAQEPRYRLTLNTTIGIDEDASSQRGRGASAMGLRGSPLGLKLT